MALLLPLYQVIQNHFSRSRFVDCCSRRYARMGYLVALVSSCFVSATLEIRISIPVGLARHQLQGSTVCVGSMLEILTAPTITVTVTNTSVSP